MKARILIVDDEPLILSGLSNALYKLRDFHGEIKTVETGGQAIKEIRHCSYSICFLDLHLPDLNGLQVMKKIREISPATKVAIISAGPVSDEAKREIQKGGALFFPKPFILSEVKSFVKQAFRDGAAD